MGNSVNSILPIFCDIYYLSITFRSVMNKKKKEWGWPVKANCRWRCRSSALVIVITALHIIIFEYFTISFQILIMYSTWRVNDLREELKKRGASLRGKKADLIER